MQAHQRVTEITGRPGKVFGSMFLPASGSMTVKISGDLLQSTLKSGVEKTDSWVRIQNIDAIEVLESPEYLLFAIGILLIVWGLGWAMGNVILLSLLFVAGGVACSVYAFINKRRLLAIYSLRYTIPVFMTKSPASYYQFSEQVMAIARHLNASSAMTQTNRLGNGKPAMPLGNGSRTAIQ